MIANLFAKGLKGVHLLAVGGASWLQALRFGAAAAVEHVPVLRQLGDVNTVVDIGANRGQFALAARLCFPEARIVSFEPLPGPAATFERVFARDRKVALHRAAIGPDRGEAVIHVSRSDDSSSLLSFTAMQDRLFPGTAEAETQSVQTGRLRDFLLEKDITPLTLVKLDVQGFELQALKGSEDLLHRVAWVYAECSFLELYAGQALADGVIAWLRDRGFLLTGVYHMAYGPQGQAIQADFLFQRRPVVLAR